MEQDLFGVSVERLLLAGAQTVYMLGWSMLFGAILGIAIALLLVMTRRGGLIENRVVYSVLNFIINVTRSVPFIILLVALIPFTRFVVGTSIGSQAALVPLTIYITPFIARMVESSLLEVKPGVIEAAQAMGATNWQIIRHFLLPEAYPSIVLSLTTSIVGLLGATAMAGYGGGGGVGDLALTYGHQRFNTPLMIFTIVILVVFVQIMQAFGNSLSRRLREPK
ncbi:methionine ABC transporter permease [Enteractinococcus fodinae]|uniref:D-methionine transport system permease protein n=1 Tax=Enteractinococcus fodinae TaxID=684663 RepID=A0ABU2B235_9MICC|nr:methionine ABC transporter permease [Enteractinococcus fodinae]MDR7347650.1 D-methionine transport system permease protein [Enteractinococcus fodinae]